MCVPKSKQHSQACAPWGSTHRVLNGAPTTPAERTCYGLHSINISSVRARSPFSRLPILIYHLFAIAHAGEASSSCKHLGGSARCCPRCAHAQAHSGQFSRPKRCNRPTYVKQTSGKSLNLPLAEKQLNTRKHLLLTPRTGLWLSSYKHAMK